jgi:hypothetical protein
MDLPQIIGVTASISLLSGWRLYLCTFATGLAMRFGWLTMPENLHALDVLANVWVIALAGLGAVMEFFADKIPWLDSIWDAVHTLVRPVGGAVLALALVDPADPFWQVVIFLLGGGGALLTHGAKAGARAVINTSPEPFSNVAVSSGGDLLTAGALGVVLTNPGAAIFVAAIILLGTIGVLVLLKRLLKGRRKKSGASPQLSSSAPDNAP